jgi:hypothetical protein
VHQPQHECHECESKRKECEERSYRWIETIATMDEELRNTIAFLDYHRARSERRAYIETLRKRLLWIATNLK